MNHAMVWILKLLSETFPTIVPLYSTVVVKEQLHQSIISNEWSFAWDKMPDLR